MTDSEKIVEEIWDTYLKDMTAEQMSFFERWVKDETDAGRLSQNPDASTLRTIITSWLAGWQSSHMCLVQEVHEL